MNAIASRRAGKSLRLSLPARHPSVFLATCAYIGNLPVVGRSTHLGSFGMSLLTPLLLWPVLLWCGFWWAVLAVAVGNFLGTWALMHIESKGIPQDHDSRAVVIDEYVGAGLASLMLPFIWANLNVITWDMQLASVLVVGLLFRVLDVTKLFPANVIDLHWHHPYAVIADDIIAALQTMLVLGVFCLIL